jgi:hypothetical protein
VKITSEQKWVGLLGLLLLAMVVLFPPWWQAAEREVDYRKEIGHAFLFRPPAPIPVDCYFVGCKTAPASYFHVLLHRERYVDEIATPVFVILALLWLFRGRKGGVRATVRQRDVRLQFSALLALLIPVGGDVPLGAGLASIPMMLIDRGEFWFVISIVMVVAFVVAAGVIYLLLTAGLKVFGRPAPTAVLNRDE